MRIWVTRTQPGANATAAKLERMGHEAVVAPVLEAQSIDGSDLDLAQADALAFTSGQAVSAFAERTGRRDLIAFVVGSGTAARAKAAGFANVVASDGDVADLADLIALIEAEQGWTIVWPRAEEPAGDLVELLARKDIHCLSQPIYRTVETGQAAPDGMDAVLIHSPRGARAAAKALDSAIAAKLSLYAISAKAAEPLSHLPFVHVAIAPRPNETSLLGLIAG